MTWGRFFMILAVAIIALMVHVHGQLFSGPDAFGRFSSTGACEKYGGTPELVHRGSEYAGWRCRL